MIALHFAVGHLAKERLTVTGAEGDEIRTGIGIVGSGVAEGVGAALCWPWSIVERLPDAGEETVRNPGSVFLITGQFELEGAVFEGGAQDETRHAGKGRDIGPPGAEEDGGGEGVEDDAGIARMADEAVGSGGANDMPAIGLEADVGGEKAIGGNRPVFQGAAEQEEDYCQPLPGIRDWRRPIMAEIETGDPIGGDESEQENGGEDAVPELNILFGSAAALSDEFEGGEEGGG